MSTAQPPAWTFFTLKRGVIESAAEQSLVDAFAADFQGLRHFGAKIGAVLDLEDVWTGALQEADLTVGFACTGQDVSPQAPGGGALANGRVLLAEMLAQVQEHEASKDV